jgi:hypothetical protein
VFPVSICISGVAVPSLRTMDAELPSTTRTAAAVFSMTHASELLRVRSSLGLLPPRPSVWQEALSLCLQSWPRRAQRDHRLVLPRGIPAARLLTSETSSPYDTARSPSLIAMLSELRDAAMRKRLWYP